MRKALFFLALYSLSALTLCAQCGPNGHLGPIGNGQKSCIYTTLCSTPLASGMAGQVCVSGTSQYLCHTTGACSVLGDWTLIGPSAADPWTRTSTTISPTNAGDSVAIAPTLPTGAAATGGAVEYWVKYVIPYTSTSAPDFRTAATSVTKALLSIPTGTCVSGIKVKHSVAFAGTGVTSMTVSGGDGSIADYYFPAFDVLQAVSDTARWWDGGCLSSTDATHSFTLTFVSNTNFGTTSATVLTAGSVSVWLKESVLP